MQPKAWSRQGFGTPAQPFGQGPARAENGLMTKDEGQRQSHEKLIKDHRPALALPDVSDKTGRLAAGPIGRLVPSLPHSQHRTVGADGTCQLHPHRQA
jgi:hypothetical protein